MNCLGKKQHTALSEFNLGNIKAFVSSEILETLLAIQQKSRSLIYVGNTMVI